MRNNYLEPRKIPRFEQHSRHAWTLKDDPVNSLTFVGDNQLPVFERATNALLNTDDVSKAMFAFEKVNGPILLISARNDAVWPSFDMSIDIVRYLKHQDFQHSVTHISYETGHTFSEQTRPQVIAQIINHFALTFRPPDINLSR